MTSSRLLNNVSPSLLKLLVWLSSQAANHNVSIYVVGGFVRDLILNRPTKDFDIVIEGDAIKFAKSLSRSMGGRLVAHTTFGTAVWNIHAIHEKYLAELGIKAPAGSIELPNHLDFITAREESYPHPSSLPKVKPGNIYSDLRRRDFTINTLAINLSQDHFGELLDPFNGFNDIQNGSIRVLHDQSFVDDPTRQLRAVRFEQRFGFHIEKQTLGLMSEARYLLSKITGIRVRHELDSMLKEKSFGKMLRRSKELGILGAIHPALDWDVNFVKAFDRISDIHWEESWGEKPHFGRLGFRTGIDYAVWFSSLSRDQIGSLSKRLSIPSAVEEIGEQIQALMDLLTALSGEANSEITLQMDKFNIVSILGCKSIVKDDETHSMINSYLHVWRNTKPYINGHDLKKLGISSGPSYKLILQELRAAWLDQKVKSREEEEELLQKLVKPFIND